MFNLRWYYAISSLIGIVIVMIGLSFYTRHLANQTLLNHQTQANINLTNSFANSIWDSFSSAVANSYSQTPDQSHLASNDIHKLLALTSDQMAGTNVVKVKIYNLDGLTVFSTDPSQIGSDKRNNKGFKLALAGQVASEITFRDEFYAFESFIVDRNLISTYLPIRTKENGSIEAVFEVYSDATPLIDRLNQTQLKIFSSVFGALSLLYLFLILITNRADKVICKQENLRKLNEEKFKLHAYNDSLTGLPNSNQLNSQIFAASARASRNKKSGALLFLDLNRFKMVNNSLGHDAGDRLLRDVATRITDCIRETDMVFRMSDDEFVIIMEDLEQGQDASILAKRIIKTMDEPVSLEPHSVIINVSIGITTFPKPELSMDELVKEAESAMYRSKNTGSSEYEFYASDMSMLANEKLAMETDLQFAIKNKQFALFYQPKVDAGTQEIIGVEALIRWKHPKLGLISPDNVIPLLEDTGLIHIVGEWVLLTACKQAQSWVDSEKKPLRMSVNISARQFRNKGLTDVVKQVLKTTGLDPCYLELELTEGMFLENEEHTLKIMTDLKNIGVSLSIDDFGSGYSSMSYLKNYPIDYLKIDRSFVKNITHSKKDIAITAAITALAKNLDLGLIAEGVENEAQAKLLQEQGCHELQGFLFSKPIPAEELELRYLDTTKEHRKAS